MGLLSQPEGSKASSKVSIENLPNQNADEALRYSMKQGAIGGAYGLIGSTLFSLLAYRVCKWQCKASLFYLLQLRCIGLLLFLVN